MKKLIPIVLAAIILALTATGCDLLTNALLGELGVTGQSEETPPSATPASETPAPTAPPSPTPDPAAAVYAELYEILSKALDEHGYGQTLTSATGARSFRGLYYADLVDFDNDGVYELLYVYGDGEYLFTCEIHGFSEYGEVHETDTFYTIHMAVSICESSSGARYYKSQWWEIGESQTTYYTIINGKWTQVLDLYEYNEIDSFDPEDWVLNWHVNGEKVDEDTYNNAVKSLGITSEFMLDAYSYTEGVYDNSRMDETLYRLWTLMGNDASGSAAGSGETGQAQTPASGWDASAPMQITTADGNVFTVPMTDWIDPTDRSVGGAIRINEPVGGIISRENNLQLFTLTGMDVSNDFGLTLVLEASTDEPFEIYLNENTSHGIERGFEGYGIWFSSIEPNQYVTVNGRTMTIRIPAQHYGIDTYVWQFNCPEYQWYDESYNLSSDLELKFAFLLEPGERPYDP